MIIGASRKSLPLFHALSLLSFILSLVEAQCNTDQNPYCAGNAQFEQLCCPYPNVCYWQNRNGDPGCCPAGQACNGGGGGYVPQPNPQPVLPTVTSQQQQLSTITSYVSYQQPATTAAGGGGIVVIPAPISPVASVISEATGGVVGIYSTITSEVGAVFSTITSDIAGAFSTVTAGVVSVATEAASGIVQVINAAPASPQLSFQTLFAMGVLAVVWQLI